MDSNCIGIIAEYNPFHKGHAYQIAEAKRLFNAENAIIVMSASFVQRGEPACADKFTRAKWALNNGADMVIELPDVFSLACAERFAIGGVKLLHATGLVRGISFGSECGDIDLLKRVSEIDPNPEALRAALNRGLSYPAAMAEVLKKEGVAFNFDEPNDILGIEYIRAIKNYAPELEAIAIKRLGGAYNDSSHVGEYSSATAIRKLLSSDDIDGAKLSLPADVFNDILRLMKEGLFPASEMELSNILLYAARRSDKTSLAAIADVSEGIENIILRAAKASNNYSELLSKVKTRRYTMARIKRIMMNLLLGTTEELQYSAISSPDAMYLRVLGVRKEKAYMLSDLAKNARLPIITRHSDLAKLSSLAKSISEHTNRASSIRSLACPERKIVQDDFENPLMRQ